MMSLLVDVWLLVGWYVKLFYLFLVIRTTSIVEGVVWDPHRQVKEDMIATATFV